MAIGTTITPFRPQSPWTAHEETYEPSLEVSSTQDSAESREILVEARHLRKNFGSHLAVKDVSFSVQSGEVLGFLGPNGAGKSTSMFMLAGLLAPTSGAVFLNGQKFDPRNPEQRRSFGIVPQEYAIYEELSAIANLMFFGRLYGLRGKALKARCDEVLSQIGLTENARRPAGHFSGGMKRRLNFGIALMHKPKILILDEPTLGVDPQSRFHLMDCIRRQTADGGCVVYASHYMEEVQAICQRVVILDQGQVVANDGIHHLLSGLAANLYLYVDRTSGIDNDLHNVARVGAGHNGEPVVIVSGTARRTHDYFESIPHHNEPGTANNGSLHEVSDLASRLRITLFKLKKIGIRVLSIETQQSNLEQLFLQLTGKLLRD